MEMERLRILRSKGRSRLCQCGIRLGSLWPI